VGKQIIKDGGPLPPHPGMDPNAKVSMENVEIELVKRSKDFMERSVKAGKPFFLWHNSTRMHVWTPLSDKWKGQSGYGLEADGMMELDWEVCEPLKKEEELGIADNTIVLFTADNGAEVFSWPDGGNTPFRGEKGTTYEGASGCRCSRNGRASSSLAPSSTRSWRPRTGCRRCSPPPVILR
jgi:arylsulfatase